MQNLQPYIRSWLFVLLLFTLGMTQQWQYRSPMPTGRKGMAVAVLEGKIWVMGGSKMNREVLKVVEVYDPATDSWDTTVPLLNVARENATARVWEGKIYLFGGRQDHQVVGSVEMYDPAAGTWQVVGQMPQPRYGMAAVVVDSAIWLIGGSGSNNMSSDRVDIYYPRSNRWETLKARLNYARGAPMAARLDQQIIVLGGIFYGPLTSYEKYDASTGTWVVLGDMLYGCGSAGYTRTGNQVWVVGGIAHHDSFNKVQIFSWQGGRGVWQEGPPLNTARRELVAAAVDGKVYAIGGQASMGGVVYNTVEALDVLVGIQDRDGTVTRTSILPSNYPNPFNGETTIVLNLPQRDEIRLRVFDPLGREVATLFQGTLVAGIHRFRFSTLNSAGLSLVSGIYFVQLRGKKYSAVRRIHLIK